MISMFCICTVLVVAIFTHNYICMYEYNIKVNQSVCYSLVAGHIKINDKYWIDYKSLSSASYSSLINLYTYEGGFPPLREKLILT